MSLRVLFWVAFLYVVVWTAILAARDPGATVAWALPDRFVPAELVVETSSCSREGDEVLWSCEAEGALEAAGTVVDGCTASFRWKSEEGYYLPNGDRVRVRAAAVPVEGVPAVAIPPEDDPRAWATTQLGSTATLPRLGLFVMLAAFALELLGRLLRVRGGDRIEVEHYSSSPGCAVLFLGLGIPIAMLGGAGIGWGVGLVAIALLAQVRRFVVVDRRERTLARGWQILLFRRLGRPTRFEGTPRVVVYKVESDQPAERKTAAVLRTAGGEEEVVQTPDAKALEKEARRLAEFLGVTLEQETRTPGAAAAEDADAGEEDEVDGEDAEDGEDEVEEDDRFSSETFPAAQQSGPIAYVPPPAPTAAGASGIEIVGGGRRSCLLAAGCLVVVVLAVVGFLVVGGAGAGGVDGLARRALAPEVARWPGGNLVREKAVDVLADAEASEEDLLALLRLAHVVDPADPLWSVTVGALASVLEAPELPRDPPGNALRALTYRTAQRLGRPVDPRGALGWFEVDPRDATDVELLAGSDPAAAAEAWKRLGLYDIADPESFLVRLGPALADPRPVGTALVRTIGRTADALPEPPSAHPDRVLVTTVGDALALSFLRYLEVEPHRADLPEDVPGWWREYATARALPSVE